MDMKMSTEDMAHWQMHKRKKATAMIVLGLIVIINTYWQFMNWVGLIGVLLVIAGIGKLMMPGCCQKSW